jgi:retinol dehydrogenase-12
VIVTGANTGIGKETAIDLARRGARVYIACRDIKRGHDALEDIKQQSKSSFVYFLQMDLASFASVRNFAQM